MTILNSEHRPKVAVVLPVYNVQKYLRTCLNSIISQKYENFVVIAVDDGSTDDSFQILKEYQRKDCRIFVEHKDNGGVSSARNFALDFIDNYVQNCKYICFIDSDDYISNEYIEKFVYSLEKFNVDYGVCSFRGFNKSGFSNLVGPFPQLRLLNQDEIAAQFFHISLNTGRGRKGDLSTSLFLNNRFFSYSCLRGLRFNTKLRACEDQDFFIRSIPRLRSGVLIPDVLFFYRRRKTSLSNSNFAKKYDLDVYRVFYKNRNQYCKSIRIGIQMEFLNHLIQNLFTVLASKASLHEKRREYNNTLSILEDEFEFPFNDSMKTKITIVKKGFVVSCIWATLRFTVKQIRNGVRTLKFYN